MALKIYISAEDSNPLLFNTRHHDQPFHFDGDKFVIVTDPNQADVIPTMVERLENGITAASRVEYMGNCDLSNKLVMIMMHTHSSEVNEIEDYNIHLKRCWFPYTSKVAVLDPNTLNTSEIVYNFYWNRQKAYYIDYDQFDHKDRLWSGRATKKMYELNEIPRSKQGVEKRFLSLNRVREFDPFNHRDNYRRRLYAEFNQDHDCYYSDWTNIADPKILESQEYSNMNKGRYEGWWPPHHKYWNNSIVSVYIETISLSCRTHLISEKTYDPLIRGHFILPFGYSGLIQEIRDLGFKLPNWIDYSYDSIVDDTARFREFINSAHTLRNMPREQLDRFYEQDYEMLLHNREVFRTRPYDSLYDRLVEYLSRPQL